LRRTGGVVGTRALASAFAFVFALAAMFAASPTAAQDPDSIGAQITIDQNAIMRQFVPPLRRPPTVGVRVEAPIGGVPPEKLAETRFRLRSVDVEGVQSINPASIEAVWRPLIGKEISLVDLKEVIVGIENVYKRNDYRAIVLVPVQDFATGNVKIRVYEAYIRDLIVKGIDARTRERLEPFFRKMTATRPVRISQVFRYVLLAEDLAGVDIDGLFVKIDDDPGAAKLELNITLKPSTFGIGLNNYGGQDVGPLQGTSTAHINDMLGLFETTDLLVVSNPVAPAELALISLGQNFPISTSGFSISYGVARSFANPRTPAPDARLYSTVTTGNLAVNYAILRNQDQNVIVNAALFGNNADVDAAGEVLSRLRARWLNVGVKYDDDLGDYFHFVLNPALIRGVDIFDSNVAKPDFSAATLSGVLTGHFTDSLSAKVLFTGQYAFTTLPVSVFGAYGGQIFGRAFDPGAIAGPNSLNVSAEVAQEIDIGTSWLPGLSLFAYFDYGAVWNPPGSLYEYASLASAGFGIRTGIGEHLVASALVAQPLWYDPQLAALGVVQSTRLRFNVALQF
jgi:hemolysin activation/secretion protein